MSFYLSPILNGFLDTARFRVRGVERSPWKQRTLQDAFAKAGALRTCFSTTCAYVEETSSVQQFGRCHSQASPEVVASAQLSGIAKVPLHPHG
eukprot:3680941-Amphidinium_carterae.1